MKEKSANRAIITRICLLFGIVLCLFWWMDCYRISVGDDLGYMFTDSHLHRGDGYQVQTVADCVQTQLMHYHATNGRVLVHLVVQVMLGVLPAWVFTMCNTVMFGLLWWLVVKVSKCRPVSASLLVVALALLWFTLPTPGMTLFSLVAFAVGYMWTSVAGLAWLSIRNSIGRIRYTEQPYKVIPLILASFFIGMLHEGMSLPICFAIGLSVLYNIYVNRREGWRSMLATLCSNEMALYLAFLGGTIIVVTAPGNFAHLDGAGGFAIESLLRRQTQLWPQIASCSIGALILVLLILSVFNRTYLKQVLHENGFLLCVILGAVLLAMLSFTSQRQLFWPSTLSIVILLRMIWQYLRSLKTNRRIYIMWATGIVLVIFSVSVLVVRRSDYKAWTAFEEEYAQVASRHGDLVHFDVTDALYNTHPVLNSVLCRYTCNPAEGTTLHTIADGYTKRGLSRIYCNGDANAIPHLVPLNRHKSNYTPTHVKPGQMVEAQPFDNKYNCVVLDKKSTLMPWKDEYRSAVVPYEEEIKDDCRIIYFSAQYKNVYLN